MNGSVLLLLPMILPFIFGLIIGFQNGGKAAQYLGIYCNGCGSGSGLVSLQRRDANLRALADI